MVNAVLIIVLTAIFAGAVLKIVHEKKKGNKCIGCPYGQSGGNGCSCDR